MCPWTISKTGNDTKKKSKCKKQKKNKSKSFWIKATALAFVTILLASVKITGVTSKLQRRPTFSAIQARHSSQFPEAPWSKVTMRELRPHSGKGHLSWRDVYHSVHHGKTRHHQPNTKTGEHKVKKRSLHEEENESDIQGGSDSSDKELEQGLDGVRLTVHEHHPLRWDRMERKTVEEQYPFYMESHNHHPLPTRDQSQQQESADYLFSAGRRSFGESREFPKSSKEVRMTEFETQEESDDAWPGNVNSNPAFEERVAEVQVPGYSDTDWKEDYSKKIGSPLDAGQLTDNSKNELFSGVSSGFGNARQTENEFPEQQFKEPNSRFVASVGDKQRTRSWRDSRWNQVKPRWLTNRRHWRRKYGRYLHPVEWNENFDQHFYDATIIKTVEDDPNAQLVLFGQSTEMACVTKDKGPSPKNLLVTWKSARGAVVPATGRYMLNNLGFMEIQRAKLHDSGLYMCYVDSEDQQYRHLLAVYLPQGVGYDFRWKYRIETCRDYDMPSLKSAFRVALLKYVCPENICHIDDVRVNCRFTAKGESKILEVATFVSGSFVAIGSCQSVGCQRWRLRKSAKRGSFRLRRFARRRLRVRLPAAGSDGTISRLLRPLGPRSFSGTVVPSCPAGYGAGKKGKCLPCEPGRYSEAGTLICVECSEGFYQPEYGAQTCLQCSSGTSPLGSKRKTACGLNWFRYIFGRELVITLPLTILLIYSISALGYAMFGSRRKSSAAHKRRYSPQFSPDRLSFDDTSTGQEGVSS